MYNTLDIKKKTCYYDGNKKSKGELPWEKLNKQISALIRKQQTHSANFARRRE